MNHLFFLTSVIFSSSAAVALSQIKPAAVERLKIATGRVVAKTSHGAMVGTAFLYKPADESIPNNLVVSCLHVVGDATVITITFPGWEKTATVKRTMRDHDLVLLELSEPLPAEVQGLEARSLNQEEFPPLLAYGARYGGVILSSVEAKRRRVGGKILSDLIEPADLRASLESVGCPSLSSEILDLEAALVHGISGGAVVDNDGNVVGICNGGLEKGSTDTCWAIPSSKLVDLLKSEEDVAKATKKVLNSGVRFSTIREGDVMQAPLQIADYRFRKIRTRTLSEFALYSDDRLGFEQLKGQFIQLGPDNWKVDVYRELQSGAALVIPACATLQVSGEDLIVHLNAHVSLTANICAIENLDQGNQYLIQAKLDQRVLEFEARTMPIRQNTFWTPNINWTYPQPVVGNSGVTVRRKAGNLVYPLFNQFGQPMINQWGQSITSPPIEMNFATFAFKGDKLLSVTARRDNLSTMYSGDDTDIAWGKAAMSVHLSTFPIEEVGEPDSE